VGVLRHYGLVYREFVHTSFAEAMTYRTHFVLLIFLDIFFYFTTLASVSFIFDHVDKIGVWGRHEFLFFISIMLAIDHLHMTFVSESFWRLSVDIRKGNLDFTLIKPIGTIFTVFFRHIRPAGILNLVVPWGLIIHYGKIINLGALSWSMIPLLVLLGITLMVSMEILVSTSMFWLIEGWGVNFLRMQMQQLSRWPDFVFQALARKVLTIVFPILLVGSAPTRFLLDNQDFEPLLGMIAAILITWVLIRYFWKLGLTAYESASS
jgi:ABC-2 type transport system permease protein